MSDRQACPSTPYSTTRIETDAETQTDVPRELRSERARQTYRESYGARQPRREPARRTERARLGRSQPNTSQVLLGDSLFLTASRDILLEEELIQHYCLQCSLLGTQLFTITSATSLSQPALAPNTLLLPLLTLRH